MKKLIYTIICFKCILQLSEGSSYRKYLKLFSQFLILCMCLGLIISVLSTLKGSYMALEKEINKITSDTISEDDIRSAGRYYENILEALENESDTVEYENVD